MIASGVVFSIASKAAGDPEAPLASFTGTDAERRADRFLDELVSGGPARWPSRWVHVLFTLENGLSWKLTLDLPYTYHGETVRSEARRMAQLVTFYGDSWDIERADAFLKASGEESGDDRSSLAR